MKNKSKQLLLLFIVSTIPILMQCFGKYPEKEDPQKGEDEGDIEVKMLEMRRTDKSVFSKQETFHTDDNADLDKQTIIPRDNDGLFLLPKDSYIIVLYQVSRKDKDGNNKIITGDESEYEVKASIVPYHKETITMLGGADPSYNKFRTLSILIQTFIRLFILYNKLVYIKDNL